MLKAKIAGSTTYFTVMRQDCKYPFRLRIPSSSDFPIYQQVFFYHEYEFEVESDPEVIVDAGANIGLATIYFANKYPAAKIIAIEPEEANFKLLKENVTPYPNVIPIQAALWNKNEEITLFDPGFGKDAFMTELNSPSEKPLGRPCHSIMGMTIDKIMEDYTITKIDILKIDIEGAEKEVFTDTAAWIEKINSLIIELHEFRKPGCNRSFYRGSNGFDNEWTQGEKIYLSRGKWLVSHRS